MNFTNVNSENAMNTLRLWNPDVAWSVISGVLASAGITRLADVTRLDVVGIPTWQAVRPAAIVLSVSQGKGRSHLDAKISAAMEAIEHASWERFQPVPRWSNIAAFQCESVVNPLELADFIHGSISPRAELPWCSTRDLVSGREIWVPHDITCVQRGGTYHKGPKHAFATTNGLASGSSIVEATLHALLEVIERDAHACADYFMEHEGLPRPQMDVESFEQPGVLDLVKMVRAANLEVLVFSNDNEAEISCYSVYLVDKAVMGLTNVGHGAHLDPNIAVTRAIIEAAQGRITMISGTREDNSRADYRFLHEVGAVLAERAMFESSLSSRPLPAPNKATEIKSSLDEALEYIVARLQQLGHQSVLQIDMTSPQVGIPVAKVLVPGLSGYHRPILKRLSSYRAWRSRKDI